MTEIEKLKIEAANWFYTREMAQGQIAQANAKLQEITNAIQQLEKGVQNGTTENS
jgi:uncharacterized protein (DUF2164 family)